MAKITVSIPVQSMGETRLEIDPWAANPLVEGFKAKNPTLYATALAEGPAPTLWITGDLPPFTSSGVDPANLRLLPFGCRHYAASEPSASRVLELIERSHDNPDASVDSPGLDEYVKRVVDWITGRTSQHTAAGDDATYDEIFGEAEMVAALKTLEQNVAMQNFRDMKSRTGQYADGGLGRGQRW